MERTEVEARIHSITAFSRLPVDYKTSQIKRSPLAIGGRVVGSGGERGGAIFLFLLLL